MTRAPRHDAWWRLVLLVASCVLANACSHAASDAGPGAVSIAPPGTTAIPGATRNRVDAGPGFHLDAPPGWAVQHDFKSDYFGNDGWKTDAAPGSRGRPLMALRMPGSNDVTDAEIRIGASSDANEVAHCTTPPPQARDAGTERLAGTDFTTFESGDAAMSHHLDVHAYRVIHGGACYAIDLLVFGTNPQVFDPPATPPFSDAQAFAAMHEVLESFRFSR